MRVIIRCAGSGTRWGDYLGVPKHLAPIAGEPILNRTVNIISEVTPTADVKVVVPSLTDRRYLLAGSSRTVDKPDRTNGDLDKIASSRHLWDRRRTVVLWGDTWWSRDVLADVLTRDVDDWHAWVRVGGAGGELFAFVFTDRTVVGTALDRALVAHRAGELATAGHNGRPARGGWALLRSLSGLPWAQHGPYPQTTQVDEWTEDFDTPTDWDTWCLRWAHTPEVERPQ